MTTRVNGYNYATVLFHWITVVWIFTMMALGIVFHDMDFNDPSRYALETAHVVLGIFGLFFFGFRVSRRLRNGFKSHDDHNVIERFLSRAVQYVFMVLLLVVPVTGLIMVLGNGYSFPFGIDLPSSDFFYAGAEIAGEAHDILTKVLAATLVLHVAGAVKHAVIDKDGTLMGILKPVKGGK